jgi:hypothetical protein
VKSFGLALLLGACISSAMAEPQWLIDARAKEGQLGEPHLVISADKQVSFSVPVPLAGALKENKNSYEASFTLAPQVTANCEILNSPLPDVALLLGNAALLTFSRYTESGEKKIEKKVVESTDAGVAGGTPYLGVVWLFVVSSGKGMSAGALHQYAAAHSKHRIYCALNALGYSKTFEKVVRALIESLKTSDEEEEPFYREASVASVRDRRVGYTSLALRHDKDGNIRDVETTEYFLSNGSDQYQSLDYANTDLMKPDGTLISSQRLANDNGEVVVDVSLKHGDGANWLVEGKFKGKELKETISGGAPSTWLTQTRLLRNLLAKAKPVGSEASSSQWLGADPGHFTNVRMRVLDAVNTNTYSVRMTVGNSSNDVVVDRTTGLSTQGLSQLGSEDMRVDRVFVRGSP